MRRHTSLYYDSQESLTDFIVPYFSQGFRENSLCAWVVPEFLGIEGAKTVLGKGIKDLNVYIEKGQIELLSHEDIYLNLGVFDPDRLLKLIVKKEEDALREGFSGYWASGDLSWLQDKDWEKFVIYEKALDKIASEKKITALCTFSSEKFDISKLYALSFSHSVTIRKKNGRMDVLTNNDSESFCRGVIYDLPV